MKIFILNKLKERFGKCARELDERLKGSYVKLPDSKDLEAFKALKSVFSNDLRSKIVYLLAQQELPVCALVAILDKDQTLISHHLTYLKKHEIIRERRIGKFRFYSLNKELINEHINLVSKRLGLS